MVSDNRRPLHSDSYQIYLFILYHMIFYPDCLPDTCFVWDKKKKKQASKRVKWVGFLKPCWPHSSDGHNNLCATPADCAPPPLNTYHPPTIPLLKPLRSSHQPPPHWAGSSRIRRKHSSVRPNHYLFSQNSSFERVSAGKGQTWTGKGKRAWWGGGSITLWEAKNEGAQT